ncbi:MAG TPA: lipase maturation factor family protein [Candidatus Limnocylindrales bacterium]|jgi:hypothetical protein|nr:lipase maturation factor family protein [Candidatus Limnocylindrales bacterium]
MAEPKTYAFASWLFLRFLGFIYLVAFTSLAIQVRGLVGEKGILPASEFLAGKIRAGRKRFWQVPTLCWLNSSDEFLLFLSWGGAVLAGLLIVGVAPLVLLLFLWVFYLSLFNVGRVFLGYQWDVLLLEAGFLGIFLAPTQIWSGFLTITPPSPLILWLFWWLLFRLIFSSGLVKLRSGDRSWRGLTALRYHYATQPLPTPPAWYAYQLPLWFQKISTGLVLLIELIVPVLIFGPQPGRYVACGAFIGLMVMIEITGNYAFFNLLGIGLSLLLLDDAALEPVLVWLKGWGLDVDLTTPGVVWTGVTNAVGCIVALLSLEVVSASLLWPLPWPRPVQRLFEWLSPFHLVSAYGLFAVMTTERPEIIIEGSEDGENWRPYEFKWKPGAAKQAPRFVAPHQPRLDWQVWFAAIGYCEKHPWFVRFLARLQEGSRPVLKLLREDPFRGKPPRLIRAVVYDYRFTNWAERKQSGVWWQCERRGLYCRVLDSMDWQLGIGEKTSD